MSEENKREAEKYKDMYLELKFKGLEDKLTIILKNQDEDKKDRKDIYTRLEAVETKCAACPINKVNEDLISLSKDLTVVRFLSQYPKITGAFIVGAIIITLVGIANTVIPLIFK